MVCTPGVWPFNTIHTRRTKMTNKNPFEIRAEMLQLAKDYMDQQYHLNIQLMNDLFEQNKATIEDVKAAYKMYSMEDLMEKAKEMYTFVSKKD